MSEQSLKRIPFDDADEAKVRGAAMWMFGAGALAALSGVAFTLLLVMQSEWAFLLSGPPAVLLGGLLYRAGKAFRDVADTDDADQEHVVNGLENIRLFFLVKCSVFACGLVLVVLQALTASFFN